MGEIIEHHHRGVDRRGVPPAVGRDHRVTALNLVTVDPRQRDGHPAAWADRGQLAAVRLESAHSRRPPSRTDLHRVIDPQHPTGERSGHDRSRTGRGEGPVHPQARPTSIGRRSQTTDGVDEGTTESATFAPNGDLIVGSFGFVTRIDRVDGTTVLRPGIPVVIQ